MRVFAGGAGVKSKLLGSDHYRGYMDKLKEKLGTVPPEELQDRLKDAIKVGRALERLVETEGWGILTQILEDKLDLARFLLTDMGSEEKQRLELEARVSAELFMHVGGLIEHGRHAQGILDNGGEDG